MNDRILPIQYLKIDENLFRPSDYFSLFLINSGMVIIEMNGKECYLSEKVVVCTNNLDKIKLLHQSSADVVALRFKPEFINVNLNWDIIRGIDYVNLCKKHEYPDFKLFLKRSPIYNGILLVNRDGYKKISEQLNLINRQLLETPEEWSCRSRGALFQIMDILNLYYEKYVGNYYKDAFIWDICQYINLNLNSDISLNHLSNHFAVNRTTLSERFKAVMGTTISEYIKSKRIERIKHLLSFTELSLSEISEQLGFSDQTYLSKIFMKEAGVTPLKYRIMMRNARPQKAKKDK